MEDYVLIFLVFTIVYTQGQNPYTSAIAFALLLLGIRYLLYKHKQKENKRNLLALFQKAFYGKKKD